MSYEQHSPGNTRPRPFADGHALTFTLREIYDTAGEFTSQYHDRSAAAYAFATAQKHASYLELRDTTGKIIADYVRGEGPTWYSSEDANTA